MSRLCLGRGSKNWPDPGEIAENTLAADMEMIGSLRSHIARQRQVPAGQNAPSRLRRGVTPRHGSQSSFPGPVLRDSPSRERGCSLREHTRTYRGAIVRR